MDDRIKFIVDIDTLVKLRFDYISTEIELSAEDKAKLEPKLREYFKEYVLEEKFTVSARGTTPPKSHNITIHGRMSPRSPLCIQFFGVLLEMWKKTG